MAHSASELATLAEAAEREFAAAQTLAALQEARARYLGRKGSLGTLLRGLGEVPAERRAARGAELNALKTRIESAADARAELLAASARDAALRSSALDVTLPGAAAPLGRLHPITLVRREMEQFFRALGFSIAEGPEVETEYYNFEALNIPPEHPSRDSQDTFYLAGGGGRLLRTQMTSVQIRWMTGRKPPFRFIAPGRVYRHDLSPRHSPMFHQIDGFAVDERLTFADLKGVLLAFGRHLMRSDVELRFRANHFPFTEPSAEIDFSCLFCERKGCATCSGSGWIEWGGCGMIHPKVLERTGIDPERYQGFAFGMGIDRTAMLRFGISQMRLLFEGDVRILEQV
jgi:phenylalanyl-tRNA synthetase alpha chain